jgi:membrane protease YdiL (CAAX protease family)
MTRQRALMIAFCIAGVAIVWAASPELPPAARGWTACLVVLLPALSILQTARLTDVSVIRRKVMYASSIMWLWLLASWSWVVLLYGGFSGDDIGMHSIPATTGVAWTVALTIAGVGIMRASDSLGMRESALMRHLIPQSRSERVTFVGVALTAGICEEIVFRGFLFMALTYASGSVLVASLASATVFGVVHAYQSSAGVVRAMLMGMVLTLPVLRTGSIYPAIAAHVLIDLIGGLWLGPRMIRRQ